MEESNMKKKAQETLASEGLTTQEVLQSRKLNGSNSLPPHHSKFFSQFTNFFLGDSVAVNIQQPFYNCLRDGKWGKVGLRQLVQGDVIQLLKSDCVPANSFLIDGSLLVDTSEMTGDSEPIKKNKIEKVMKQEDFVITSSSISRLSSSPSYVLPGHLIPGTKVIDGNGIAVIWQVIAHSEFRDLSRLVAECGKKDYFLESLQGEVIPEEIPPTIKRALS